MIHINKKNSTVPGLELWHDLDLEMQNPETNIRSLGGKIGLGTKVTPVDKTQKHTMAIDLPISCLSFDADSWNKFERIAQQKGLM